MITGEAWTGKTACSKLLYEGLNNSAWLDGDDVWKVNPFSVNDSRLRNSDYSMAFVVDNYLKSGFEYVVFSSIVLLNEPIRNKILHLISFKDFDLIQFTLYASKEILTKRAYQRDHNTAPEFWFLEKSLKQKSYLIDTSNNTPEETVIKINKLVTNKNLK